MPRRNRSAVRRLLPWTAVFLMAAGPDPSIQVVLALGVIYLVAMLVGEAAVRIGQPAVLGELVGGVLLGNLPLVGIHLFGFIGSDPGVDLLAQIGILVLLFEVGLESNVHQMLSVGLRSLLIAVVGVTVPFALGWISSAVLLPEASRYVHAFLGATLSATSVGITARVLKDLGRLQAPESRLILGAAVIDDVLGIVILAVVTSLTQAADSGGAPSWGSIGLILAKAVVFLIAVVVIGLWLGPRIIGWSARLLTRGAALAVSLSICFLVAYAAHEIGLAAIIGAFAAGLVLESTYFRTFVDRGDPSIEHLLHPLIQALVPVFFVLMGVRTDLSAFLDRGVLGLAATLSASAIVGKLACGWVAGPGVDRLVVGIGMVPRGEVGLIFANLGLGLTLAGVAVISRELYSAVVVMVIVTTMTTPPALKWAFGRMKQVP